MLGPELREVGLEGLGVGVDPGVGRIEGIGVREDLWDAEVGGRKEQGRGSVWIG